MPVKQHKGAKGKCDKIFSLIIRSKGHCERCSSRDWLQTAHIISRRYSGTRTDTRNAFCLCAACHRFFTDHPVAFGRYVEEKLGPGVYDELNLKAQRVAKMDWDLELERLKEIYSVIEAEAKT